MDNEQAARIIGNGTVIATHSGDHHREHCHVIDGRPWIYPGETIVEFEGKMYVYTLEGPLEPREE